MMATRQISVGAQSLAAKGSFLSCLLLLLLAPNEA